MDHTAETDRIPATQGEYLDAVAQATAAASAYYTSEDIVMDDGAYDALVRSIAKAQETHPEWSGGQDITTAVAAGVASGDVAHTVPMLSLENTFSETDLDEWEASLTKRLGRPVDGFTVEPKMDGLALAARYRAGKLVQLITRGDGTHGEDVTFAAAHIVGLPTELSEPVDVEVRGEVLLTDEQFARANELRLSHGEKPFSYARSGSAGALRGAKDRTYAIPLTFFCYGAVHLGTLFSPAPGSSGTLVSEGAPDGRRIDRMRHCEAMDIVARLGVTTTAQSAAGMAVVPTMAEVHIYIQNLGAIRARLGFAVDGAVVKADSDTDRDQAGFSSKAPRWAIARKYPADTAISTLEEVLWQVGRTGVITPRARITPTIVGGTEITYATLHNPTDLTRKGFLLGDKVTVLRAGEVIPRLEAPVLNLRDGTQTAITIPQVCPRCQSDIDRTQVRWRCQRGRLCGLAESIKYAVARDAWDIEGFGDKLVAQAITTGLVTDVADLFTLTREQLLSLDRMGTLSADKILAQIEGAKAKPLSRTLIALGIRMTGRSMSRRLAKHFGSMDNLLNANLAQLEAVDGVGPERALTISGELIELRPVIDRLMALGLNPVEPGTAAAGDAPQAQSLPLLGENGKPLPVVVTGAMTGALAAFGRTEMNELIERAGGKASGSVSKNTAYLVSTETNTSKALKAATLGVPILTPDEFADLVKSFLP
jgi:DNA ligase (NAD+)